MSLWSRFGLRSVSSAQVKQKGMFRRLLGFLSFKEWTCPKRFRSACAQSAELVNLSRLRPVVLALAALEVYFLLGDFRMTATGHNVVGLRLLYPDLSLVPVLLVSLVFVLLRRPRSPSEVTDFHRVMVRAFAFLAMAWCAVVAAAEEYENGQIITFVIGVLAASVLLYAGWLFFTALLLTSFGVLLLTASAYGIVPSRLLADNPSLVGMLLFGWLISRLLYRHHSRQFTARLRLALARKRLIKVNRSLRSANRRLAEAQMHLVRQEKLASIGQLAAGTAHEINNPIAFLKSNLSTLRQHFQRLRPLITAADKTDPANSGVLSTEEVLRDVDELFHDSDEGFNRVTRVVRNLLDFSRVQSSSGLEDYDLHAGLESTLTVAHSEYRDIADIVREYGDIPLIPCRGGEINQVFLNIVTNAAHAIRSGNRGRKGTIRIRTWRDGDMVHCAISDDGPPIPPEDREKIFDPFFTTKPAGQGTGLGLSIAYDIVVKRHGGELTLAGDEITTFTVSLPLSRKTGSTV